MNRSRSLPVALAIPMLLGLALPAAAEPFKACAQPVADYSDESAVMLRAIGASCRDPEVARLFYNRAYARELLDDYQTYLGLIPHRTHGSRDGADYQSFRMFLGLAEAFAGTQRLAYAERIAWLNRSYEQATELAELRMKGYDRVADQRARQMQREESEL